MNYEISCHSQDPFTLSETLSEITPNKTAYVQPQVLIAGMFTEWITFVKGVRLFVRLNCCIRSLELKMMSVLALKCTLL